LPAVGLEVVALLVPLCFALVWGLGEQRTRVTAILAVAVAAVFAWYGRTVGAGAIPASWLTPLREGTSDAVVNWIWGPTVVSWAPMIQAEGSVWEALIAGSLSLGLLLGLGQVLRVPAGLLLGGILGVSVSAVGVSLLLSGAMAGPAVALVLTALVAGAMLSSRGGWFIALLMAVGAAIPLLKHRPETLLAYAGLMMTAFALRKRGHKLDAVMALVWAMAGSQLLVYPLHEFAKWAFERPAFLDVLANFNAETVFSFNFPWAWSAMYSPGVILFTLVGLAAVARRGLWGLAAASVLVLGFRQMMVAGHHWFVPFEALRYGTYQFGVVASLVVIGLSALPKTKWAPLTVVLFLIPPLRSLDPDQTWPLKPLATTQQVEGRFAVAMLRASEGCRVKIPLVRESGRIEVVSLADSSGAWVEERLMADPWEGTCERVLMLGDCALVDGPGCPELDESWTELGAAVSEGPEWNAHHGDHVFPVRYSLWGQVAEGGLGRPERGPDTMEPTPQDPPAENAIDR